MSIALLELAAAALADLVEQVVFVGGATVGLWITDPAAPPPRPTKDVDVIVDAASRTAFAEFEQRLREHRFHEDVYSGIICRWLHADGELILDAMPTNPSILGFANHWQAEAMLRAVVRELPSGAKISAVSPPFLIATKLEAFASRGHGDYLASRDFADIVSLVDGRVELVDELARSPAALRAYVADELQRHQRDRRFLDGVHGGLPPDAASQDRAGEIVVPRMLRMTDTR